MSKDIRILLIKLADRLHNMRTLEYVDEDKKRRIAQETREIYVPRAHRVARPWKVRAAGPGPPRGEARGGGRVERRLRAKRKARERYIEEVIGVGQARREHADHLLDVALARLALGAQPALQLGRHLGLQRAEGQVLELRLHPLHAEPVRERHVDLARLLRDAARCVLARRTRASACCAGGRRA